MVHYTHTPSTPAIELLPRIRDRTPTMLCLSCGDTMKHVRTIAELGLRPRQFIFACPSCKGIDTKESKRVA
jgi:hypothetical protein